MKDLAKEINAARDWSRYCVIFDKNENCPVFFTYKATMKDIHKHSLAVKFGSKRKKDALEDLRKSLVAAMRKGDTYVINMDNLNPDFKTEW